jgi:putative membrane protein
VKRVFLLLLLASCPVTGFGHSGTETTRPQNVHDLMRAWEFDIAVVVPLILSAWFYFKGVRRLWKQTHVGCGMGKFELTCFITGWLSLVVALVSPLHPMGRALFSAHMTQHEILMLISAPLLVLSRPMLAFLKAIPTADARDLATAANWKPWQRLWRVVTQPLVAWVIHAVALWTWHVPSLFDATITSDFVHALQHISFLGSALLFWWAVVHARQRAMSYGLAVLYMFTTAMHSGALGALLSYANALWYPAYANTTQSWGLTPVEDQQLGGLIMWVPAGLVYVFAALVLFAGWLRESEVRVATAT